MCVMPLALLELVLSSGESLDLMLDRHIYGVLDVVFPFGALCMKT